MTPAKVIIRFILLLGLSHTLLMLAKPGLRPAYARLFRAGNQLLLGSFGRDGVVRFGPTEKPGDALDCRMHLRNRRRAATVEATFSSDVGYSAAALLTALLLSTPLSIRRRAIAWLWGMLLLYGAVALTLLLQITFLFGSIPQIATFSLSDFWHRTLGELTRLVLFAPFFSLVISTFIWILVTFRREDFGRLFPSRGERSR